MRENKNWNKQQLLRGIKLGETLRHRPFALLDSEEKLRIVMLWVFELWSTNLGHQTGWRSHTNCNILFNYPVSSIPSIKDALEIQKVTSLCSHICKYITSLKSMQVIPDKIIYSSTASYALYTKVQTIRVERKNRICNYNYLIQPVMPRKTQFWKVKW